MAQTWFDQFKHTRHIRDVCPPSHPRKSGAPAPAPDISATLTAEQRAAVAEPERLENSFSYPLPPS